MGKEEQIKALSQITDAVNEVSIESMVRFTGRKETLEDLMKGASIHFQDSEVKAVSIDQETIDRIVDAETKMTDSGKSIEADSGDKR